MSRDIPMKEGSATVPTGPTRRDVVLAAAAVAAQATFFGWPGIGDAQTSQAAGAAGAADPEAIGRFLAFSKAITGHDDIDPTTAARIHQAMQQGNAAFSGQSEVLARLVQPGMAPDALLTAATSAGVREAALAVVTAWYTGTVVAGSTTTVVAYEQALMYRPVADALTVPTYCNEGPMWWTAAPPEVGVPTPQEAARPSPTPPPVMRSQ
ncbi:sugar dehydrogenase complex small subunit [Variovorax sp. PAMC26660]|uniref:sugar dehydrogenase complex small subunit n=1 Tax=Variovorax sp. PAMC26660 TaxID=2762322 RepID=UPI00164D9CD1|nr:sugar dehydrogenase complex small subunit [Variovorax sp. PAMC26660]QNK69153.1 D-sorbitol dehydrogenase [Variovorax sp. PAMC26660]